MKMNKQAASTATATILPLQLGSELLIEFVSLNLRIKSVLKGIDEDQFILAKLSPNDLIGTFRSDTVKESPIVIRYLYKGSVYSFDTKVQNILSTPAKLIFFEYPKKVLEAGKVTERYECILPALTMLGNDIVEMVIVDLSRDGCQSVIKTSFSRNEALYKLIEVNRTIELKFQLPGVDTKFSLKGRIRNMSKEADRITLGIMFEQVLPEVKARISNFISLIPKK